ncbi:MAG: lysophospholipid acyltransferase family protein [Candidatus Omnitrophota bacterium]
MIYTISRFISFVLLRLFFNLKTSGQENLPRKTGYIVASNHTSFLDPIILGVSVPIKLKFMARDTLFINPLFALFLKQLGVFPIKRGFNDFSAIKKAIKFLKNGHAMVMFPQGSRDSEEVRGIKAGVALLAESANVPVVPAYVSGASYAWPKHASRINFCDVSVKFGRPIYYQNELSREYVLNKIMESINNLKG